MRLPRWMRAPGREILSVRLIAAALILVGTALAAHPAAPPAARASALVNEAAVTGSGYPALLSEYGFFADTGAQKPGSGVTSYRLNTPL